MAPQLLPGVVQHLVERAAVRVQALGEDVDRHAVDREGDENTALVRSQHVLDRRLQRLQELALLEAAVKLRKRSWQGREVPLEPEGWALFSSTGLDPAAEAELRELLQTLQAAIEEVLTPRQRSVLVALAVNGVPIDVLAERLDTNRGALYKTLHDARRKLRRHLEERGLALDTWLEEN